MDQGFPLYAVDKEDRSYIVLGWINGRTPLLLANGRRTGAPRQPDDSEGFTFTTTDPTRQTTVPAGMTIFGYTLEQVAERLQRAEEADTLRDRMAALADRIKQEGATLGPNTAAGAIREELAK